jgi:hypothetical protein
LDETVKLTRRKIQTSEMRLKDSLETSSATRMGEGDSLPLTSLRNSKGFSLEILLLKVWNCRDSLRSPLILIRKSKKDSRANISKRGERRVCQLLWLLSIAIDST